MRTTTTTLLAETLTFPMGCTCQTLHSGRSTAANAVMISLRQLQTMQASNSSVGLNRIAGLAWYPLLHSCREPTNAYFLVG
jgi:hypothetical protein